MGRVVIQGFYGMGNLGDEAILHALRRGLADRGCRAITVFCREPGRVRREHGVPAVRSEGRVPGFARGLALARCSLFVLGGGGLLKDYGSDSWSLRNWLRILRRAKRGRCRTALGFVGVENIRYDESREALRETVEEGLDAVVVRDEESAAVLREVGVTRPVTVAADPALLLGNPDATETREDEPRIAVALRHWFSTRSETEDPAAFEEFLGTLASGLDALVESRRARITFVPFRTTEGDDDRLVADRVRERMRRSADVTTMREVPSLPGYVALAGSCDLVIAMRLHALILACASAVPVLGFGYMPKVGAFLRGLGREDLRLPFPDLSRDELVHRLDDVLVRAEAVRDALRPAVIRARERVERGMEILASLATERDR